MPDNLSTRSVFRLVRAALPAALLALALLVGLRPAAPVYAACGGVTPVANETQLNDAIDDFNGQTGSCDYEIEFGADITLTADLLVIQNSDAGVSLLIDGAGFALNGDAHFDLIDIQQTDDVTIDRLTVTRGVFDAIVVFDSNLRVSRSSIVDNGSDGIDTNASSLILIDSTVADNDGDGVEVQGTNGQFTPSHVIINSTITRSVTRGVIAFDTDVLLTQVTAYRNGSGLVLIGTSNGTVNNSILGQNLDDCLMGTGTIDINHSLIEDSTTACGATDGVDDNIVGQDAVLGALGDYGGPTHTMPPLAVTGCKTITSPAVNAGDNDLAVDENDVALGFDQRGTGFPRITSSIVNMGAVEGPVAFDCPDVPPTTVTTETELNDAIADFNGQTELGNYEIKFGADISLTADLLGIENANGGVSLLIDGAGFTLDGLDQYDLIDIQNTDDVTIHRLTVTGSAFDAIVVNDSNLRVSRSSIIHNGSDGIDTNASSLVIIDSTVADNEGDGVEVQGSNGHLTPPHVIINSTISGNETRGVIAFDTDAHLAQVTVYENESGLVFNGMSNGTVNNSILGGHISDCLVGTGTVVFDHSLIENSATACGAGDGVNGNIVGQAPTLGTLDNNGGPTQTHLPDANSDAVDAGDNDLADDENGAPLTADQRGFVPRVVGGTVDMGAVEVGAEETAEVAVFMSATTAGITDDAVAFDPRDILMWDGAAWSKWFDGAAAFLVPSGHAVQNINAVWIPDPAGDDAVFTPSQNVRDVPGVPGKVNGMDLVWWDGSAFSLWFDGEDVGLTNKNKEKIDALHVLDGSESPIGGSCDAYLLISTQGDGQVPNHSGGVLRFDGTDVLGFCLTNSGANTTGFWHRVLNGKAEGMPGQALTSLSASDDGEVLYLTTRGAFNVDSAAGGHSMVYRYDTNTHEFDGPHFSARDNGLPRQVDALHVDGQLP